MDAVENCPLCGREDAIDTVGEVGWVFRDQWWSIGALPGVEVPGWLVIQSRTHVTSLWDTDPEAQLALGRLAGRTSEAIQEATGAERVYLTAFGETIEHWHMLVAARPDGVPAEGRGPQLIAAHQPHVDPVRAAEVESAVRVALADFRPSVGGSS